ncbi:MAG: MBL fold metallo-hydrolase [Phycisphaerae bacterium]
MPDQRLQFHVTNDQMFAENGYTLYLRDGGACWIVDPGLPPQAEQILEFIGEHRLQPLAIMLTHAHADHIAGIDEVVAGAGELPIFLGRGEWPMLTDPDENLSSNLGMPVTVAADNIQDLTVGAVLELDSTRWVVGDVSGHSPDARSFYCAEQSIVIVGDALFAGSIGRSDFHHSDAGKLLANIRETLLTLPDDTRVLSGHGPETTIGLERAGNPFLV